MSEENPNIIYALGFRPAAFIANLQKLSIRVSLAGWVTVILGHLLAMLVALSSGRLWRASPGHGVTLGASLEGLLKFSSPPIYRCYQVGL